MAEDGGGGRWKRNERTNRSTLLQWAVFTPVQRYRGRDPRAIYRMCCSEPSISLFLLRFLFSLSSLLLTTLFPSGQPSCEQHSQRWNPRRLHIYSTSNASLVVHAPVSGAHKLADVAAPDNCLVIGSCTVGISETPKLPNIRVPPEGMRGRWERGSGVHQVAAGILFMLYVFWAPLCYRCWACIPTPGTTTEPLPAILSSHPRQSMKTATDIYHTLRRHYCLMPVWSTGGNRSVNWVS